MPSPLPPEVETAAIEMARRFGVLSSSALAERAAAFRPILHSLWLSAQVAQAEEDMNAVCDKRPSSRHGQYRGGDRRSRGCPAWKIHDRLASLRAQLQEMTNAPR